MAVCRSDGVRVGCTFEFGSGIGGCDNCDKAGVGVVDEGGLEMEGRREIGVEEEDVGLEMRFFFNKAILASGL